VVKKCVQYNDLVDRLSPRTKGGRPFDCSQGRLRGANSSGLNCSVGLSRCQRGRPHRIGQFLLLQDVDGHELAARRGFPGERNRLRGNAGNLALAGRIEKGCS